MPEKTIEELAQEEYEREAKNWPNPTGWDNLSVGAKAQWIGAIKLRDRPN